MRCTALSFGRQRSAILLQAWPTWSIQCLRWKKLEELRIESACFGLPKVPNQRQAWHCDLFLAPSTTWPWLVVREAEASSGSRTPFSKPEQTRLAFCQQFCGMKQLLSGFEVSSLERGKIFRWKAWTSHSFLQIHEKTSFPVCQGTFHVRALLCQCLVSNTLPVKGSWYLLSSACC